MKSCINGSFSDEIDYIAQKELYSVSLAIHSKNKENKNNILQGLDNLDSETKVTFYNNIAKNKYLEYEIVNGPNLILTSVASTLTRARERVYEEANELSFNGIYYRKDI
jgi:phosphoribosylamine-glycine ligase